MKEVVIMENFSKIIVFLLLFFAFFLMTVKSKKLLSNFLFSGFFDFDGLFDMSSLFLHKLSQARWVLYRWQWFFRPSLFWEMLNVKSMAVIFPLRILTMFTSRRRIVRIWMHHTFDLQSCKRKSKGRCLINLLLFLI